MLLNFCIFHFFSGFSFFFTDAYALWEHSGFFLHFQETELALSGLCDGKATYFERNCFTYCQLTRGERVVPPVGLAEERLQVVGGASHHHVRRRDECPDQQAGSDGSANDAQSLEQGGIRDLHSLRRSNSENHRYPVVAKFYSNIQKNALHILTARSLASELRRSGRSQSHAAKCAPCRCRGSDSDTSQYSADRYISFNNCLLPRMPKKRSYFLDTLVSLEKY